MSRRKISKGEARLYWKLIAKGYSHIKAWSLSTRFYLKRRLVSP